MPPTPRVGPDPPVGQSRARSPSPTIRAMSDTTIISRKRLRGVFAGGLAVLLVATLGTASRSVPMVPTAFRRTSAASQRRLRLPAARTQQPQQQVETIADTSGWNWRAAGVRYVVGFHPQ